MKKRLISGWLTPHYFIKQPNKWVKKPSQNNPACVLPNSSIWAGQFFDYLTWDSQLYWNDQTTCRRHPRRCCKICANWVSNCSSASDENQAGGLMSFHQHLCQRDVRISSRHGPFRRPARANTGRLRFIRIQETYALLNQTSISELKKTCGQTVQWVDIWTENWFPSLELPQTDSKWHSQTSKSNSSDDIFICTFLRDQTEDFNRAAAWVVYKLSINDKNFCN